VAPAASRSPAAKRARNEHVVTGIVVAALIAALASVVWLAWRDRGLPASRDVSPALAAIGPVADLGTGKAEYVGSEACASCHAAQAAAWRGSQHERAMQEANAGTVRGDFGDVSFSAHGVATRFARRDGAYVVSAAGEDGKPVDVVVKYTFGVAPLQQYLVETSRGRLQALGVAWDTRSKAQGGQRWFDLYPDRKLAPGDALHWTGIDQNWNYQCADCHSTNLRKAYDERTSSYATTWSEASVGCEACHGPGSQHVAWANRAASSATDDDARGLVVDLDERRGVRWTPDPASGNATRSKARMSSREVDTCGRCHARRGQFSDAWQAGQPLGDAFRPALLSAGLYHADGQQRDEVYTWGSFLQSRMHAKGVTCSDCHDPHTQKLRAPGNAVCASCHAPAKYDAAAHTRHAPGSAGTQCAACHMPTTTYMIVDPRHDHSLRIPRPDRSVALGVPNACNGCHADRTAAWAAERVAAWHPRRSPGFQAFAEAFDAADRGAPGAADALVALANDRAQPAIVRASALQRLARTDGAASTAAKRASLADADALVRAAAVGALASADASTRASALAPLLDDPVRLVRIDAARALAGEPEAKLSADDRARFDRALAEYVAAQRFNADRPEAHAALADLYDVRGLPAEAEAAYRHAISIDATYAPASLNLADLLRRAGREADAEQALREALARSPFSAPAHHALGLALIRARRIPEALDELAAAAKLAPDDARFAYVYAVALHDTGKPDDAVRVLRAALARRPHDRDILLALKTYERDGGEAGAAANAGMPSPRRKER
jgi:tetratricopeptide (TPR) repeat protein